MKPLILKRHGLPGVGSTGKTGNQGKSGPGVYFGYIEEFFKVEDLYTDFLNEIYKKDDIIYFWTNYINTQVSYNNIEYLVVITKDLEKCNKEDFLNAAIKYKPLNIQNVVNSSDYKEKAKFDRYLDLVNLENSELNATEMELYADNLMEMNDDTNPLLSLSGAINVHTTLEINDEVKCYSDYNNIIFYDPSRNNKDEYKKVKSNGDNLYIFTIKPNDSLNFINFYGDSVNNKLSIIPKANNSILFSTDKKLKFSNLYVKDDNIGNLDTLDCLVTNGLTIDNEGNSYTLDISAYDVSSFIFTIDPSKLFTKEPKKYHHGFIHTYWNYNDSSTDITKDFKDNNIYKSNYIYKEEYEDVSIRVPILTETGSYIKDWDRLFKLLPEGLLIPNELIYALGNLYDVSSISEINDLYGDYPNFDILQARDFHGIIKTEEIRTLKKVEGYYNLDVNVTTIVDPSYFSGISIVNDPSENRIHLHVLDPSGNPYRHHEIKHWVMNERGIKFYSKPIKANYNYYDNSFELITYETSEYQDVLDLGIISYNMQSVPIEGGTATIDLLSKSTLNICNTYVDGNSSGQQSWYTISGINDLSDTNITGNIKLTDITSNLPDNTNTLKNYLGKYTNETLLNDIYNKDTKNTYPRYATISSVYKLPNSDKTYVHSELLIQPGYIEERTIPKIDLIMHNQLEDIEQYNSIKNGVLCNEVRFFMDVSISDFDNTNWGKYSNIVSDIKLNFVVKSTKYNTKLSDYNDDFRDKNFSKITSTDINYDMDVYILDSSVDMFSISQKDLSNILNLYNNASIGNENKNHKQYSGINSSKDEDITLNFSVPLEDACKGPLKVCFNFKCNNPNFFRIFYLFYVDSLNVTYIIDSQTKNFSLSNNILISYERYNLVRYYNYLYKSEPLKVIIAPISYTLIDDNLYDNTHYFYKTNKNNEFGGSNELLKVSLSLYDDNLNDNNKQYANIKKRYLQDNILSINITPININNIQDLILENTYQFNKDTIKYDEDDIEDKYVSITYNATLLSPKLYHDEISFVYNNEYLLASKYSQLNNNTAFFIRQDENYEVRNAEILNYMEIWNKKYKEDSLKTKKDRVFNGHIEANGNGYNYIEDKDKTLNITKEYNEKNIFETIYSSELDYPQKSNIYQPDPDKLYRSILYNIKWQYPIYNYDEINDITTIKVLDISTNYTENTYLYNMAYSIYPRSLYNDEEGYNIIFMLRCPSVVNENQYSMTTNDLWMRSSITIDTITNQSNPLNVLY